LIVWADNDEEQEGLHANFKLSSSGETVLLSNAALDIINEVSFGQQFADTTTGRFPNGTGEFMLMEPTFGMENDSGLTNVEKVQIENLLSFKAFPNPVTDKVTISFHLKSTSEVSVKLYNIYGQPVQIISLAQYSEGNHDLEIETSNLSSGIWFCNLIVDGKVHNLKLLRI